MTFVKTDIAAGDPISATDEIIVRRTVNGVLNAWGAQFVGDRLIVPPDFDRTEVDRYAITVEAISDADGSFAVGEVVQITQVMELNNPGTQLNEDLGVMCKTPDARNNRPIGIVVDDFDTGTSGRVALAGTCLAQVKREAGFPGADEDLLKKHGVL